MAQIATVTEVVTSDSVSQSRIAAIPVGSLSDVALITAVTGMITVIAARFPVPPSAIAFLTAVDAIENAPIAFDSVFGFPIGAALTPESLYLEPTIGQIWPR